MSQVEHEFHEATLQDDDDELEDVGVSIVFYCESGRCRSFAGACCFMIYLMWYVDIELLIADLSLRGDFTLTGNGELNQMNLRPFVLKFGEYCRTQHTEGHAGYSHPIAVVQVNINRE
jgi:hypothetical protein